MAIDPTQLAADQEALQRASLVGSPTEFAKGPEQEMRVAGGGTRAILELLNRVRPQAGAPGPSPRIAPRVPTPQEQGLVEAPGQFSQRATQEALAPQVLSPEGVEEFRARGFQAVRPDGMDILQSAQDAIKQEAEEAAALATDVVAQSRRGVTAEARGFGPEAGVAPEAQADEFMDNLGTEIKSLQDGGDFNFDYLNTPDDVKRTITALGETFKDAQTAITRGVRSNQETLRDAAIAAADELGLTRRLLARKIGDGTLSAEMMVAARDLLVKSAAKLNGLAVNIKSGQATAEDRLAFRRQLAIHAGIQLQVKGAQTEAGRTLQSFRIPVAGELDARRASEEAQRMLADAAMGESTEVLADRLLRVQKESGLRGVNEMARRGWMSRTKEVVHELYLAGLLSSTASQVRNILGTASFAAYQLPVEMIAGMYGSVIRGTQRVLRTGPIAEDQVYMQDALLRMKGWSDSFKDALKAASIAWKTELPASASKLDVETYGAISSQADNFFGHSINTLGRAVRIPFRLLLTADEFSKTIAQRGELYTAVNRRYQSALNAGKTQQEALDEAGMLLLDPRSMADDLDVKAKYDTMQSDLGAMGKVMGAFQRTWAGRFILPFATAPTNSMMRTTEILGIPLNLMTPRQKQLALSRATVAAAGGYMITQYVADGRITGGMPQDPKLREKLSAQGWQPYSFVIRGEGFPKDENGEYLPLYDAYGRANGPLTYISYQGIEPLGGAIGIVADTAQRMTITRDPEMTNNLAAAAVGATANYYKELPMLQGLGDVVSMLEAAAAGRADFSSLFRSPAEAASIVGVPSPVSSLQRAIQRAIDPTRTVPDTGAEYYTMDDIMRRNEDGSYVYALPDGSPNYRMVGMVKGSFTDSLMDFAGTLDALQSKDSFIRDERDRNAVVYDTLGNVMGESDVRLDTNPGLAIFNNFSGIRIRPEEELGPVEQELMRLTSMTNTWPLSNPEAKNGVRLTAGAIADWVRLGKVEPPIRPIPGHGMATFREALDMLFTEGSRANRAYVRLSDKDKVSYIRNLEDAYMNQAFEVLLEMPEHANLAQAVRDREAARQMMESR